MVSETALHFFSDILVDIESVVYISVGTLAGAWLLLAMFSIYLWGQNRSLRKQLLDMGSSRFRVQKVKMDSKNHAYQNPDIAPGEELSRRGYSMYNGQPDLETGQGQKSNPVFVEDLQRQNSAPVFAEDIQRQNSRQPATSAPPFLLSSIETNKRKSLNNPVVGSSRTTRNSNSNPNFMY